MQHNIQTHCLNDVVMSGVDSLQHERTALSHQAGAVSPRLGLDLTMNLEVSLALKRDVHMIHKMPRQPTRPHRTQHTQGLRTIAWQIHNGCNKSNMKQKGTKEEGEEQRRNRRRRVEDEEEREEEEEEEEE